MLMILGREPLIGLVPVVALKQVQHNVIRDLLVGVELGVLVMEERFRIGDADYRFLREHRRAGKYCETNHRETKLGQTQFHAYYR